MTGVLLSGVWLGLSVTIALAYAFAVVAGAARRGGSTVGLRTGGWTAAIGTFLGIGAISVVHLLPQSLGVVLGLRNIVEPRVAYGFGAYALEGMILFLLPAGMLVLPRLDSARRRRVGLAILLLAAGLAIWRITGIFEEVARR